MARFLKKTTLLELRVQTQRSRSTMYSTCSLTRRVRVCLGSPANYTPTDIMARKKLKALMCSTHRVGMLGLPTEQFAIKTGQHPAVTLENIGRFQEQLKQLGYCYDWNHSVNTTTEHFRWTQWIFLQLFKRPAYVDENQCGGVRTRHLLWQMKKSSTANQSVATTQ